MPDGTRRRSGPLLGTPRLLYSHCNRHPKPLPCDGLEGVMAQSDVGSPCLRPDSHPKKDRLS